MTVRRAATAAAVIAVVACAVLGLVRAAAPAGTPSLRERVDAVAATLRCPSCQGLSIEDSTSVLAAGSRRIIEQQLEAGRSPDEIRQWFVDRYGPTVLLSPDPAGPGLLAWLVPGLVLLAGGALVVRWLRRRGAPAPGEDDAAAALAAWRDGRLEPDDSPAGDALREALLARAAAEEDGAGAAGTARLGEAYRRYTARPAIARPRNARPRATVALPRRALTLAAAGAVVVAAASGAVLAAGGGNPGTAPADPRPAAASGGAPSPPPGWSGGMPQTAADWVTLGRAYDRNQQPDQAVAAYTMALQLQPGDDGVLLMRADVLVRSGRAEQALPDLQALDARHPVTPDVLLLLGLAQNRTGAPQGDATLRRFLELAPDSPAAPGVRRLLEGG